jgi:hypothetical protein
MAPTDAKRRLRAIRTQARIDAISYLRYVKCGELRLRASVTGCGGLCELNVLKHGFIHLPRLGLRSGTRVLCQKDFLKARGPELSGIQSWGSGSADTQLGV